MVNYSIHTYELYTKITFTEYFTIYTTLKDLHISVEKQNQEYCLKGLEKTTYIFRKLPLSGINSIKITQIKCNTSILQCNLYIIINPFNAISSAKESDERIISSLQISEAVKIINKRLTIIFSSLIINRLSLYRIDFCINLYFSTQLQAEEYIKLLRLGIPIKVLKERMVFNKSQHRNIPYEDSLLLECDSYSFEIYPKYIQMKKRGLHNYEQALGIVRIELRADKSKIAQIAKKYQINYLDENYSIFLESAPNIAKQEINHLLSKMVGTGNFHSYSYVKRKIESSSFKESEIQLMLQILSYFPRRKYSHDFLDIFNLKHKDWKKILQKFNYINCSPISVPNSYSLETFPGIVSWDNYFNKSTRSEEDILQHLP